jgi:hypothetical protein
VEIKLIEKICGAIPQNFSMINPSDSNYIFNNDPNFSAINMNDFFGRAATVNSFSECAYYVNLGFEPQKFSIFNIGTYFFVLTFIALCTYAFLKLNIAEKLAASLKNIYLKSKETVLTLSKNTTFTKSVFSSLNLLILFFLYSYVKSKAIRITPFIDEYITLTSNVGFFKELNFNAGNFIGGNYSVAITTGPIAALGSVFGWEITNNFITARVFNFFWVLIIQMGFFLFISKTYKSKNSFLFLISGISLVTFPWWQGIIYSIGEIPSTLFFINAIFLFNKNRKISIILFSISIFYGKILNALPFAGFYLLTIIKNKEFKLVLQDTKYFIGTLTPWLILVQFKYDNGNLFQYILDQFNFILNHESSGLAANNLTFIDSFIYSLNTSEFANWNTYDRVRLLIIPIVFLIILYRNKSEIDKFFGKITLPLMTSVSLIYIWFWIINSTKWMRHTQHFTVCIIITSIYLINFNIVTRKSDLLLLYSTIFVFLENNKILIGLSILSVFIVIVIVKKGQKIMLKNLLVLFLLLDISIPYFESSKSEIPDIVYESCIENLRSDNCRNDYFTYLNNN